MKIEADRAALAAALSWTALAVPKRPMTPSLAGIKLTATAAGQLVAQAFDNDNGHTAEVDAKVGEPGEVVVSGRFLAMIVEYFRGDTISLELDAPHLVIKSGRSTYKARTLSLGDFPPMPAFGKKVGSISADTLARIVRVTAGPIDDAAERQATAGLHLEEGEHGRLFGVGTDDQGRSLHVVEVEWVKHKKAKTLDVTIPVGPFALAVRGLSGDVAVGLDGNLVSLRDSSRTVTFRPYASAYMPWRKLTDTFKPAVTLEVVREDLVDAFARANAFGDSLVGVTYVDEELTITGGSDIGDGLDIIEAPAKPSGGAGRFGLNTELMAAALNSTDAEKITIALPAIGELTAKPIEIRPVGDDSLQCLVMPRAFPGGGK